MAPRILVVDAEPHLLLSLKFLLEQAGFQVATATNGDDALVAMEAQTPELVLVDLLLPGKDGFTVCQEIRARSDWQGVKIVILAARGRQVEREKALALGADDYIVKPFAIQQVEDTLKRLLETGNQHPA